MAGTAGASGQGTSGLCVWAMSATGIAAETALEVMRRGEHHERTVEVEVSTGKIVHSSSCRAVFNHRI